MVQQVKRNLVLLREDGSNQRGREELRMSVVDVDATLHVVLDERKVEEP